MNHKKYSESDIQEMVERYPILENIMRLEPITWLNTHQLAMEDLPPLRVTKNDMLLADLAWKRFAPFIAKAFPETEQTNGVISSPLKEIPNMKAALEKSGEKIPGRLFLKCDNELPIAGSIKARGGIYEVLHYAEQLAVDTGILKQHVDYDIFASDNFRRLFSKYTIGVGSTGNLGLSIGIISTALGFKAAVYMSADAKQWKKDLLREKGAEVLEFEGDFGEAITIARKKTNEDEMAYFVDDENSKELYVGYSLAALEIEKQLEEQGIRVDADHPLFVYSPCGVGGSPGGIAFGLKQIFGDDVHCFFVEPTHSPAVLTGLVTGEWSSISVQDIGVDNQTEADGLAVGRPSGFATEMNNYLVSGLYTVEDEPLYSMLAQLMDTEQIFLEPSATTGLFGPQRIAETEYLSRYNFHPENITHIAWATGGSLVPEKERKLFYERGKGDLG